jgi:hypothetical protein
MDLGGGRSADAESAVRTGPVDSSEVRGAGGERLRAGIQSLSRKPPQKFAASSMGSRPSPVAKSLAHLT